MIHSRVVSLDGHRMAIRKIALKDHYESTKVIVPGKTLNEISKILSRRQRKRGSDLLQSEPYPLRI